MRYHRIQYSTPKKPNNKSILLVMCRSVCVCLLQMPFRCYFCRMLSRCDKKKEIKSIHIHVVLIISSSTSEYTFIEIKALLRSNLDQPNISRMVHDIFKEC